MQEFIGNRRHLVLITAICLTIIFPSTYQSAQEKKTVREPLSEASKQWLEEVVPYIITRTEKEVFISLPSEIERGRFIESFWKKRDPVLSTPENEFKIEYYRRIALANKFFGTSGISGWRTDQGRIFILLGPPHEVQRDFNTTDSSGFNQVNKETWQYWDLPNPKLPYNVEFSFIDKYGTGNFVLYKDYQSVGSSKSADMSDLTYIFDSMELLAEAQKNPFENLDKIKTVITTQVTYDLIPFDFQVYSFKGAEGKTNIPLTINIPYSSLPSKSGNGKDLYSLSIVANISDQLGQVVTQKSKDLNFQLKPDQKATLNNQRIQVQTSLVLAPGTYGIHIVVWDNISGKTGSSHQKFIVPNFDTQKLAMSDIFLSAKTCVNGNVDSSSNAVASIKQLIPATINRTFRNGDEFEVGFEIYNLVLNEKNGQNSFKVNYAFLQGTSIVLNTPPLEPEPSAQKECQIKNSFRLKKFSPGEYILRVTSSDMVAGVSFFKEVKLIIVE